MMPLKDLPRPIAWLAIAAFISIGIGRIVATYPVFNEVFDEPPHIACGMEWLQRGTYNYERKHTPLARIAIALPLYIRGIRGSQLPDMIDEGHAILYSRDDYATNLGWARSGNLPFFVAAAILIALWARRWWGWWTAVASVALFTMLPPILGHAAIATTDMSAVFGVVASVYAFCLWLEKPGLKQALLLSTALSVAMLGKLSILPFFFLGAIPIVIGARLRKLPLGFWAPVPWRRQLINLTAALLLMIVLLWAPYHFRLAPLSTGHGYRPSTGELGTLGPLVNRLLDTPIPLGEFLGGLGSVATFNKLGYMAFFEGAYRDHGWWTFFPVVLAIKTPIAFLLLVLLGIPLAARSLRTARWQQGVPLVFAAAILISCVMSSLNLGIRHMLPIYPFLALLAGSALVSLTKWGNSKRWMSIAAVAVLAAFTVESITPHPDYMASFNILAGKHPEKIVVSSDLDWGQDLRRLSTRLAELKVPSLSLLYSGASVVSRFGLPPYTELKPGDNPTGWVAISATRMMLDCAKDGNFCDWKDRTPNERVGRSIFLYYIPPR